MIKDSDLEFASNVSVAAAAGTALIGSQIDTGIANYLDGTNIGLVISVKTGIITGGSAGTVQFALASDTTAAVSTTTSQILYYTPVFVTGASTLPAGTILFACSLPRAAAVTSGNRRFLGLLCITGTTTTTAGAIDAFLTTDIGFYAPTIIATN